LSDAGIDSSAAAFEAPGEEPVFAKKDQATMRRTAPASAQVRFAFLDSSGKVERTIAFSEADRKL